MALLVAMALLAPARLGQSESVLGQAESVPQAVTGTSMMQQAKIKQKLVGSIAEDSQGPLGVEAADGEQRANEQAENQQHADASTLSLPHGLDFALKKLAQLEVAVRQHARQLREKDGQVRELRAELRRHAAAEPQAAHSARAEPDGREKEQLLPAMAEQAAEARAEMAQALLAQVVRQHREQMHGRWRTAAVEPAVDAAHAQEAATVAILETSWLRLPGCTVKRPWINGEAINFGSISCTNPHLLAGGEVPWPSDLKEAFTAASSLLGKKKNWLETFVGPIADMVKGMLEQSVPLLQGACAATFPSLEEGERVLHSSNQMTVKTSTQRRPAEKASLAQTGAHSAGDKKDTFGTIATTVSGGIGWGWGGGDYTQTHLMTQFGGKEKFTGSCLSFAPKGRTGPNGKISERDWQAPNQETSGNSATTTRDFVPLEPWAVPCGNKFMKQRANDWEGFTMVQSPAAIEKCVSLGINFNIAPTLALGPGVSFGILPQLLEASVKVCWPSGSLCPCEGRSGALSQFSLSMSSMSTPVVEFVARDTSVARSNLLNITAWEVALDSFLGKALGEYWEAWPYSGSAVPYMTRDASLLDASLVRNGTSGGVVVGRLLRLADGDGDDALSPQELARAGLPPADADGELLKAFAARFEAADGDADGRLRRDELASLLRPPTPGQEPGELVLDEGEVSMASVSIGLEGSAVSERVRGAAAARRMQRQFSGNASRAGALLEEGAEAQAHTLFTLDLPTGPFPLKVKATLEDAKVKLAMSFGKPGTLEEVMEEDHAITLFDLKKFIDVMGRANACLEDLSGTVAKILDEASRVVDDALQKSRAAAMDAAVSASSAS